VLTGHFIDPRGPWGAPEAAIVLSSLVHAGVYAGYVWMVGRAGAVFAAQVSYLVTPFGVLWAMAIPSAFDRLACDGGDVRRSVPRAAAPRRCAPAGRG
jgi:hypothetical protein